MLEWHCWKCWHTFYHPSPFLSRLCCPLFSFSFILFFSLLCLHLARKVKVPFPVSSRAVYQKILKLDGHPSWFEKQMLRKQAIILILYLLNFDRGMNKWLICRLTYTSPVNQTNWFVCLEGLVLLWRCECAIKLQRSKALLAPKKCRLL